MLSFCLEGMTESEMEHYPFFLTHVLLTWRRASSARTQPSSNSTEKSRYRGIQYFNLHRCNYTECISRPRRFSYVPRRHKHHNRRHCCASHVVQIKPRPNRTCNWESELSNHHHRKRSESKKTLQPIKMHSPCKPTNRRRMASALRLTVDLVVFLAGGIGERQWWWWWSDAAECRLTDSHTTPVPYRTPVGKQEGR